jgi:drug/metabolite transporter (DMT)-like permease
MSVTTGLRQPSRLGTVVGTELGLVAMSLIWGLNFAVLKFGTRALEPLAFNGTRMVIGSVALLAAAQLMAPTRPHGADLRRLLALGVLGHGVYQVFFITGLSMTRAGTAALVVASSPAAIAIVGRLLGVERVSPRAAVGIVLSILGIALVVLGSARAAGGGEESVLGDLLILASTVAWAFYTNVLRSHTMRIEGIQIAAWTLVGGTIPLLFVATPQLLRVEWSAVTPLAWGALLYGGIGALGIAYLFWYRGVRVIGSTRTAMFSQLQPLVALLGAWAMLGERPTSWQLLGSATVMGGLLLTREPGAPEPAHGE